MFEFVVLVFLAILCLTGAIISFLWAVFIWSSFVRHKPPKNKEDWKWRL